MNKTSVILVFSMSIFLFFLPLFAQQEEVKIPNYIPADYLTTEGIYACFMANVSLVNGEIKICEDARKTFIKELGAWIKQAEQEGFIEKLEIPADSNPSYEELQAFAYSAQDGFSSIDSFSMLNETRELVLSFFPEADREKTRKYRTSSPIDIFEKNINKEEKSLFHRFFTNPAAAPYLKALMKTIRLYVFYAAPLEDKLDSKSVKNRLFDDFFQIRCELGNLITTFKVNEIKEMKEILKDDPDLPEDKVLYGNHMLKAKDYLSQIDNLENIYKKMFLDQNKTEQTKKINIDLSGQTKKIEIEDDFF